MLTFSANTCVEYYHFDAQWKRRDAYEGVRVHTVAYGGILDRILHINYIALSIDPLGHCF